MDRLYWLDEIKAPERSLVGDKAFNLSRVMQRGYPVVPGFVVSAQVLRKFLENLQGGEPLVADLPHSSLHLNVDNSRQLQQVAQRLRQEVVAATVPGQLVEDILAAARQWKTSCLILRPSVAIFPGGSEENISGLLESQVCRMNAAEIAAALKQSWSQLFRARSLLYWQRAGISLQRIHLGVLVQPLRNAIASGLTTTTPSSWEIQATCGLGVAIARGEVLPDIYQIERSSGAVTCRQLGNKMLAYRVEDAAVQPILKPVPQPVLTAASHTCLQAYLLESAQQQYALSEEHLHQLINLVSRLGDELGTIFSLEWTISHFHKAAQAQLYLTQVNCSLEAVTNYGQLQGLAAASGQVLGTAYVINNTQTHLEPVPAGAIVVAPAIAPNWLPLLQSACGVITEQGGITSHAAILARELGIPAVVNVPDATTMIKSGEQLLLDGDTGEINRENSPSSTGVSDKIRLDKLHAQQQAGFTSGDMPTGTQLQQNLPLPPIGTQLLINVSQANLLESVSSLPVDGVGLLRSELMALNFLEGKHPQTWLREGREVELQQRWQEELLQFARAFGSRPVFYRSLDWRSHEFSHSPQHTVDYSTVPMLGARGTFSYLQNPAVFDLELQAIAAVQQSGHHNLHLLLPFVRTVEEFVFCRQRVVQAGLTQIREFQLWMMAEVPSVLFLLPEYVKAGVQGISIGSNDLTQLLLGVDRDQGQLAAAFDERHPAVMSAISQLIHMAGIAGIPCCICGQAPVLYPEIIDKLVQWGITSISVEPEAVERTQIAIARAEQRLILAAARQQLQ